MTDVNKSAPQKVKKENIFFRILKATGRFFANIGKSIGLFFKNFVLSIGRAFKTLGERFKSGSIGTKLSYFICGSGNFYHGQITKGIIFLLIQVGFILFMVLCPEINRTPYGYKALVNLVLHGQPFSDTLQTPETASGITKVYQDDSVLFLLFGLTTIAIIILYVCIWVININSSYKADMDVKAGKKPTTFKQDCATLLDSKFHILMLTPTCLAALIFTVIPTIFMICLAFTTYNQFDMNAARTLYDKNLFHWNGFYNFADIFQGDSRLGNEIAARFFPVLGWTFIWAIFATFTCYFGGILLAILINKKGIKFKKLFRTIFIFTIAIPQFISLLAMRKLLSEAGPFNDVLINMGLIVDSIDFLGTGTLGSDPTMVKTIIIIVNMWLGIPYTMLMTSGILMNIPSDLYEAARVDGAGKTKMLFKITFPYIIFVTTPYLISSFVGNINSFNTIFLLTGGGPSVSSGGQSYVAGETDLLVTWLYKLTIDNYQYNTGAIIGIFTFLITATITLFAYRRSKAYKEEDTFQ